MVVAICGRRVRGDFKGIFTCSFILCCWAFAVYSANVSVLSNFFAHLEEMKKGLIAGRRFCAVEARVWVFHMNVNTH